MHGLGNDFIIIDNFNGRIKLTKEEIDLLCNRHKGIGADGLILVESSSNKADCLMNYYNSDGSKEAICGNGTRCVAKFLKNNYLKDKDTLFIETGAGIKKITCEKDGTFSANMGKPIFSHTDFPNKKINLEGLELNFVSIGNPHAVAFVDNLNVFDLEKIGPIIENNSKFPNKINFELVEKNTQATPVYKVLVWERGCGATLACGTGACAVFAIIQKQKNIHLTNLQQTDSDKVKKEITIELPGGKLFISENKEGEIIMRGEAKSSFSGEVDLLH
jgi:diaminopimelate epimerase